MEILTRRFRLREFVDTDRSAFLSYHADPRYLAFHGPDEAGPEHAARLVEIFETWASEHPRLNYQLAVVQRQEPHGLVGCGGLRGAECEAGRAVLGIELAPDYWGRYGYAIEVGRALLDFGFTRLGLEVISGSTVSGNTRILRLAEWFGGEVEATRPGPAWMSARGWNEMGWRITRQRWQRRLASRDAARPSPPPGQRLSVRRRAW